MSIKVREQLKKILGPNVARRVALVMISIVGMRIMTIRFNNAIISIIFDVIGVIVIICGIVIYRESAKQINK